MSALPTILLEVSTVNEWGRRLNVCNCDRLARKGKKVCRCSLYGLCLTNSLDENPIFILVSAFYFPCKWFVVSLNHRSQIKCLPIFFLTRFIYCDVHLCAKFTNKLFSVTIFFSSFRDAFFRRKSLKFYSLLEIFNDLALFLSFIRRVEKSSFGINCI